MTDPCEGKYDIVSRLRDHTNRDDNDIAEAAAYIERLRAERDEARQEVMSSISDQACRFEDVDEEYKKRGWEYLQDLG